MPAVRTIGIFFFAVAAGCARVGEAPPSVMAQSEPPQSEPQVLAPPVTAPSPAAPRAKAPAKVSASPVAIEQPRKNEKPIAVAKALEPPLDVAALKARLRDTNAIGMFTKLALKNQVDDLLKQFRAHYQSGQIWNILADPEKFNSLT